MERVQIHTEYITLGQLLKYVNLASSGGEVKQVLATHTIVINGEQDQRRGRKIYPGSTVLIKGFATYFITDEA